MQVEELKKLHKTYKEKSLNGRYIFANTIKPLLLKHGSVFKIETIGYSVLKQAIHEITIGSGKTKILIWSQMHGNESTTTKAVFDLLNVLTHNKDLLNNFSNNCTIKIIPILNPDGAKAYTRFNANKIDLNRDAKALTQPESLILRNSLNKFKPNYCFNLHGQRTIFSAGNTSNVATVSFLSPAQDQACEVTESRQIAMAVINKMNAVLQKQIPNQVGVYDDAFNINCVGDMFQTLNIPTVLFEAGHYVNDYDREVVRGFIFQSLIVAINSIAKGDLLKNAHKQYALIPENKKLFFDIIIKKAKVDSKIVDIAIQYSERLVGNKVLFIPIIIKIEKTLPYYAHRVIEANKHEVLTLKEGCLFVGLEIDLVIINNTEHLLIIN